MGRRDRFATQRHKQQAGECARALRFETRSRGRHGDTIWNGKGDCVATSTSGASPGPQWRRFSLCKAGRSRIAALSPEPRILCIRFGRAMTTTPGKLIPVSLITAFLFSFGAAVAQQPGIERRIDSLLNLMT